MKYLIFNRLLPLAIFTPIIFATVGYLISLVIPITILIWSIVLLISLVFCVGILVRFDVTFVSAQLTAPSDMPSVLHQIKRMLLILSPLVILLPGIYATLTDPWVQVMFHGDLHTSLINQIHHGTFPPVNPKLPYQPVGYYWLYHAFLATLSYIFSTAAPLISAILNLITLGCTLLWVTAILHELGFRRKNSVLFTVLILFVLFSGNLFGVFHVWDTFFVDPLHFNYPPAMVIRGDERLYGVWGKYLNFNSFPLSFVYYMSGLYAVIRLTKGDTSIQNLFLYSGSVVGGVIFQLATGAFLAIISVPALVIIYLLHLHQRTSSASMWLSRLIGDIRSIVQSYNIAQQGFFMVGHLVLFVSTLIYGLTVLSAFPDASSISGSNTLNLDSIFNYMYPIIPFFMLSAVLMIRRCDMPYCFVIISTTIGVLVTYLLVLAEDNQYKFVYLTAILMSISVTRLVHPFLSHKKPVMRYLRSAIFILITVLIGVNTTIINIDALQRTFDNIDSFVYDGRFIGWKDAHQPLWEWIRDETPTDTILIRAVEYDMLYTSMYSERLPYVGYLQFQFISEDNIEYKERFEATELFFNEASTLNQRIQAVKKFRKLKHTSNILLMLPDTITIPENELTQLGFRLAFEAQDTRLYWLRHNGHEEPLVYTNATPPANVIFTFGDETIQLQGIKMGKKDKIQPCESFWVSTWWQVTQPQDTDYLMKLVVVNSETNDVITNTDAVPSATLMTAWQPDKTYTDTRTLDIPCDLASGEYLLLIGMYEIDYDTLEFVADLPVFYQGAGVGNLGFVKTLLVE